MIDPNTVKARIEAFHRRNGAVCYSDGAKWYYPNGAYRDVEPLGVLADPLDPRTERGAHRNAENIVTFHRLKLRVAVADFDKLNLRLSTALPVQPDRALAELERLRKKAEQAKQELAEAEEKLDATEIGRRRKEMRQGLEEERQRFQEFQEKRRAIRI